MKVNLWSMGKTKSSFFVESEAAYEKRIKHYFKFEKTYFSPPKNQNALSPSQLKKEEAKIFLKAAKPSDFIVLLDENGKHIDSRAFAQLLQDFSNRSVQNIIFIIGGAYGFADLLKERCNYKLSLSKMTFSHQIVRTIFLEQLYRAGTINKGEAYHND